MTGPLRFRRASERLLRGHERALFLGFSLGWLRTKENFFVSTPIDAVREMPERVQQLLGYETHGGIGVVDVGCPSALLRR